jgi:DNA polymerase-3 subunit alpha
VHTLIESYSPSATVTIADQTFPERCLLEDEDGQRLMLVRDTIKVADYTHAVSHGAGMIVRTEPRLAFVLNETFSESVHPDTGDDTYFLDSRYWTAHENLPTFFEAFQARYAPKSENSNFVHLHAHSEYSPLDGLSTPEEMVNAAVRMGQKAMAITDHGTCAGQPAFQIACDKGGIKPILGIEAYFVDDRSVRENRYDYWHLILLAQDQEGLRNLWAMSTESFRDGYYDRKPRLDWETLERYAEGVLCSTACLRGPVVDPYLKGDTERAVSNLGRLKAIFGDRLYAEIHANQIPDQIKANRWLTETARTYDVPLVAVCDSHYPTSADADAHRVWLSITTNKDVTDDSSLFQGQQDYSLRDEVDVRVALSYLAPDEVDEAVANTSVIAERCTARIEKRLHMPVYSRRSAEYPDPVARDKERLFELCMQRWEERTTGKTKSQDVYLARFEREFNLIVEKGFPGYFLIVWDIISHAKRNRVMVSPGRGSGGGCLLAYLLGITELDSVEDDILFERFMTKGRTELPDFDLDFPSSKKQFMFDYIAGRWGRDNMAIVGTHMRLKNKSVFKDVSRALKSQLPEGYYLDIENICKIVDNAEADTAGLGLSYEQLFAKVGEELEPYREKYPEVFRWADLLNHRLKTYGTHPAGIVIDTEAPLTENLPLRAGDNGMVTQFALEALESLGYVKFDLLNLRNLDTLQICCDLIKEHTGRDIDPYSFTREELSDPMVFERIGAGWTLGMFQINTHQGTRLCTRYKPQTLVELAHVLTLVRPGPSRSGLTDLYLRRRETGEEITYPDERLRSILGHTEGIMLFQEQLMQICLVIANYTDVEADKVRKILGKKKVELAKEEGRKFIAAAVDNDTDEKVAIQLWEQMEEFAKYSFGYAHAMGYGTFTYWTGWLMCHYPLYMLCAALSSVKAEEIPTFVEEARRMGYAVLPPDINLSRRGFTVDPANMAVRYGLESVDGVGPVAVDALLAAQPFADWEDFVERKTSKCNSGHVAVLNKIGAFESITGHRRWLELKLELEAVPSSGACVNHSEDLDEHELPCSFDWSSLPPALGKTGKLLAKQPGPPKKCSRACKQFQARQPEPIDLVAPYTAEDIRRIEDDVLGVFLSSTPFDRLDPADREECLTAEEVLTAEPGRYLVAAIIKKIKNHWDSSGSAMCFLEVATERGQLPVTVFGSAYAEIRDQLVRGSLCLLLVKHDSRGQILDEIINLDMMESTDA